MSEYIYRLLTPRVLDAYKYFPVITITGPRQSGKTSLCKEIFPDFKYVNLEDIVIRAEALKNPTGFLDLLGKKAIIDEVQHAPDLMSMIQVRVDEDSERKYILTGSSNFTLLRTISQSLAGRTAIFTLLPFSLIEINPEIEDKSINEIIFEGLYPKVIAQHIPFDHYYRGYYNTYVERDLRDLINVKNMLAFDTFIRLLASRIGSELNFSSIARETGVTSVTIKEWFSLLMTSYIVFPLQPYYRNISKQLVKMPKIYFYDTGLACFLLGIDSVEKLATHHLKGALFENLAICELIKKAYNVGKDPRIFFYREKSGIEVDAVVDYGDSLHLYEIKSGETVYPDVYENMNEVSKRTSMNTNKTIIFNGQTFGDSLINIRDI